MLCREAQLLDEGFDATAHPAQASEWRDALLTCLEVAFRRGASHPSSPPRHQPRPRTLVESRYALQEPPIRALFCEATSTECVVSLPEALCSVTVQPPAQLLPLGVGADCRGHDRVHGARDAGEVQRRPAARPPSADLREGALSCRTPECSVFARRGAARVCGPWEDTVARAGRRGVTAGRWNSPSLARRGTARRCATRRTGDRGLARRRAATRPRSRSARRAERWQPRL